MEGLKVSWRAHEETGWFIDIGAFAIIFCNLEVSLHFLCAQKCRSSRNTTKGAMEAQETIVFVKETGQEEYDILYLNGVPEIELFHDLIKDALNVKEEIIKLTMDGIAIRNANGIRFMLKKPEPKIEVTFAGTGGYTVSAIFFEFTKTLQMWVGFKGFGYGVVTVLSWLGFVRPSCFQSRTARSLGCIFALCRC